MKKSILILTFSIFSFLAYSQEEEMVSEDSTDKVINFTPDISISNPFIQVSFGNTMPLYRGFEGSNMDRLHLAIGFEKFKKAKHSENILKHTNYGLFGDFNRYDLGVFGEEEGQQFSMNAFGFMDSKGYGWKLGENSSIILGIEDGWGWTALNYNFDVPEDIDPEDNIPAWTTPYERMQDTYSDNIRFTEYYNGYIQIKPIKNLSFTLSHGRQIVFPRFQFWYYTVSGLSEGVADGLANMFVKQVMKKFENAAPIVYFVLKNGISYAFYQLRKDRMHWPMNTAPALTTNTFNFGMTFHF